MSSSSEAFVTLATSDGYALGALVLGQSLRQVGTSRSLVVLISTHLSSLLRRALSLTFDEVLPVEELNSNDTEHLRLLARPELGVTFTKLHCWLLEKYSKCVFLDADVLVLQPIDDLFLREEFSAAPDAGWPDCFNSGVFVYRPSKETHRKLMEFAHEHNSSFDGGDQGLLNRFFANWRSEDIARHLPFTYNVTANAFYSYLPAISAFRAQVRVVHFAGALKPWHLTFNPQSETLAGNLGEQNDIQREFLLLWWRTMLNKVWPQLSNNNQSSDPLSIDVKVNSSDRVKNEELRERFVRLHPRSGIFHQSSPLTSDGRLTFAGSFFHPSSSPGESSGVQTGSAAHRRAWEAGNVDYQGRDSFSQIQQQLEKNIAQQQPAYHPSQPRQTTPTPATNAPQATTTAPKVAKEEKSSPPSSVDP